MGENFTCWALARLLAHPPLRKEEMKHPFRCWSWGEAARSRVPHAVAPRRPKSTANHGVITHRAHAAPRRRYASYPPRSSARVARSRGDISFRLSVIVVAGNGLDPPGSRGARELMTRVAPVSSRLPFPCPSSRAPPRRSARPESDLSERPVDPLAAADEQTTSGSRIAARTALRCVAGAAIAGLALFAVAGFGIKVRDTTRDPLAAFHRCVQFPHASETHTSLTLPLSFGSPPSAFPARRELGGGHDGRRHRRASHRRRRRRPHQGDRSERQGCQGGGGCGVRLRRG